MKRSRFGFALSVVALVALGLGGGAAYVSAADDDSAVVEGELVDMKCYVAMGMPGGGKHNKCAMDCAKMGIPAGVVDSRTGQVFTVLAPTPGLAQYMGKTVHITGSLAAKSTAIIPDKLEISEDGKWKAGELPESMM